MIKNNMKDYPQHTIPTNPFQEYSNCCGSLMDNDQTMCPECLEPCEKETRDERGMTWQTELQDWIKNQHGSAGWEQKLEAFIQDLLDRKAREIEELKKPIVVKYGQRVLNARAYNDALDQALNILKEE